VELSEDRRTTDVQEEVLDDWNGELIEHIRALRRYSRALAGSHADADDLVQEALKRALVYLDGTRRIDNLRAYLFTILHNVRVDALKKQMRAGTEVPVEDAVIASNAAAPSERIACREAMEAIHRLSEEHREVLLLVGVEGMSYREAAEILDLPIGTVMSRLSRARAALREMLDLTGDVFEDGA
jgi:RNA polymerase sigma-70 factor (ECF subfamily)